jgi:amidohydrolase
MSSVAASDIPAVDPTLLEEARDLLDDAIALRRDLHRRPELGNHLPLTRERVLEALDGLPLNITLHESTSGIVATLDGGKPGPTVLLRGDMDALPMPEDTGEEFASGYDDVMHACGHDCHVAMLAGSARLLAARREQIAGRVMFMFQPGEEGHHGAKFMLEEGLLDRMPMGDGSESPVTGAFALHITSSMPTGMIAGKGGALMASADTLRIVITGRGGHASQPHSTIDPIPIACEIVTALQTFMTRRIDVFDPGIITVAKITAGTTNNVIPETAEILGTIRAVSELTRQKLHDGIRRVAQGIAATHEASAEVELTFGYPVTINHDDDAARAMSAAGRLLGQSNLITMKNPVMGSEDFSYVLQKVPGSLLFLGATPHDRNPFEAAPNHSNRVFYDEQAMVSGMAVYSAVAMDHLARAAAAS